MYSWGASRMPIYLAVGTAAAIGAYSQSKEKTWLYGAAALASILPYTLLDMNKTNGDLNKSLKESGEATELEEPVKKTVTEKMHAWINMHSRRVVIALGSATIFFVAKQYTKSA